MTAFLRDERAVSQVISVILMVAITVILAAVIGGFVLGVGSSQEKTPEARFDVSSDLSADTVTVEHAGGATIDEKNSLSLTVTSSGASNEFDWLGMESDGQITSGETVTFGDGSGTALTGYTPSDGDTIELVWTGPNGDRSVVVFEDEIAG